MKTPAELWRESGRRIEAHSGHVIHTSRPAPPDRLYVAAFVLGVLGVLYLLITPTPVEADYGNRGVRVER